MNIENLMALATYVVRHAESVMDDYQLPDAERDRLRRMVANELTLKPRTEPPKAAA